jgi:hypothetical protein
MSRSLGRFQLLQTGCSPESHFDFFLRSVVFEIQK